MAAKQSWREITPVVSHLTAIVWAIFRAKGVEGMSEREAPLEGFQSLTVHLIQPGKSGNYHVHYDREQVYYFTKGGGKMNIDDVLYPVKMGDAVCVPIGSHHQMMNDTDEWLEHLIISGQPVSEEEQEKNKAKIDAREFHNTIAHRSWLDSTPHISHGAALMWPIFTRKGAEGRTYDQAPLEGIVNLTIHRLQPGLETKAHAHGEKEQVFYFTSGCGKMIVGDEVVDVREGDAVHGPVNVKHAVINDSDDWLEHLVIGANVARE